MKKIIFISIVMFFPVVASAQTEIIDIVGDIGAIISAATPIVVALALFAFFWGLAKYIFNAGDEEKKSEGRNIMIWGIIALFVMVSVWGLVNVLVDTFAISGDKDVIVPRVI